jgi:WD40 repeat protein
LNGEKLSEQTTPFKSRNCKAYFLGLAYISSPILLLDSGEAITVLPPSNDDQWRTILQEMDISYARKLLPPKAESYLQQNWKDFDYDFELSPDGRYVALSLRKGTGSSMVLYDVSEDEPLYWWSASFTSGSFSLNSTLFTMILWDTIKMIDLSSNENMQFVTIYEDQRLVPYAPMAISPDLKMLAAVIAKNAMSETVGFIKINDGTLIYQWPVGNDEINNIRFSEDGKYLIVSTYGGWIDILGIYP